MADQMESEGRFEESGKTLADRFVKMLRHDGVDTQGLTKKLMIDVFGPWRPLGAQQLGDLSC